MNNLFNEMLKQTNKDYVKKIALAIFDGDQVTIENGEISILNDGGGIPIEIHKEIGKYIPEIIFGEFHTSSNYDDNEKRTVGGLNGYGSKLTNAFSKCFTVEIADSKNHYIQTWENNMSKKSIAKIIPSKKNHLSKSVLFQIISVLDF